MEAQFIYKLNRSLAQGVKKDILIKAINTMYSRFDDFSENSSSLTWLESNLKMFFYGKNGTIIKKNKYKITEFNKYIRDKYKKLTKKSINEFLSKLSSNQLLNFICWHLLEEEGA